MKVKKRDGREVDFNKDKIFLAIKKAMKSCKKIDDAFCMKVSSEIEKLNKDLTVEEIQDLIEKKLMASSYKDVAKSYILYRNKRSTERFKQNIVMKKAKAKLSAKNIENQNANVDEHSFGGRIGEASDIIWKELALEEACSDMAKENHNNNLIYIHDLNSYLVGMHNCLSIPFDDLLANGFNTRQSDIRAANSVNTAFQLLAVIFQLQSLQQFGGVSATHLDWTMVPYIRKSFYKHYVDGLKYIESKDDEYIQEMVYDIIHDKDSFVEQQSINSKWWKSKKRVYQYAIDMTEKELEQAVEGMYHNLNY